MIPILINHKTGIENMVGFISANGTVTLIEGVAWDNETVFKVFGNVCYITLKPVDDTHFTEFRITNWAVLKEVIK